MAEYSGVTVSIDGSHYGYADAVNRRARIGVVLIVVLVVGIAWAANAVGSDDSPPPTVLAAELIVPESTIAVTVTTTTLAASSSSSTLPASTTGSTSTTTTLPDSTTTTTRPTTTTTRLATTTTRPTTTTSTTTTTTLPPTTTTTTTSTTVPPTTTTTTTTIPPTTTTTSTTTTTLPEPLGTIHIYDLKGDDKDDDDRGNYARIEVVVRNDDDRNQRGVRVIGRFSGGYVGDVAGVTNNKGKVIFESGTVTGDTVTFRVTNLTLPGYVYAPEDNRRGPAVVVDF